MARFSIGTAIGDAFALIRRRPLSVWVWGLLLSAPGFIAMGLLFPVMLEIFADMPAPDDSAAASAMSDRMFGEMMQLQLASMLSNIGQLLVMAVVFTAIFRAVLRPNDRSLFSLRIGMDELRVFVVGLAIGVGLYAAMLVFIMVGMAIGFAAWTADDRTVLAVTIGVMVLIMLVAAFLALARVSMMAPASVLYRDFAFVQGWRLAAGKTLPLFGMMVLIFVIIVAIQGALVMATMTLLAGVGAFGGFEWTSPQHDSNPLAALSGWVAANWYWVALAGIVISFLYGALITLSTASYASACRQLAEGGQTPRSDEPSPVG